MNRVEHVVSAESDELSIDRTVDEHAAIVRAVGEVDLTNAPLLSEQLRLAEEAVTPPAPVILDLTGLTFLGSAGLAVLVVHHERCAERGTSLRVVGGRLVRRVLEIAGLDRMFPLVPGPRKTDDQPL
jgi:anti-anti-sigma factor